MLTCIAVTESFIFGDLPSERYQSSKFATFITEFVNGRFQMDVISVKRTLPPFRYSIENVDIIGASTPIADPTFTGTATIPTAIIGGVNIKSFSIAMGAALA